MHPAASAGAIFRVIIAFGKFQGVMMPRAPIGSLRTRMRRSARWRGDGRVPPMRRRLFREPFDEGGAIADFARASSSGLPCSASSGLAQIFQMLVHQCRTRSRETRRAPASGLFLPYRIGSCWLPPAIATRGFVTALSGTVPIKRLALAGSRTSSYLHAEPRGAS